MTRRYQADWSEETELDDGSRVLLRLVKPEDAALLSRGFARLSAEGRYRRFLWPRRDLSAEEIDFLCHLDGEDHFALGALDRSTGEGLGLARFVRLPVRDQAEPAVTVVDHAQGKGLGRLLLRNLACAAVERGVHLFHCTVLATNEPMRKLLCELAPKGRVRSEGVTVEIDAPLPPCAA